MGYNDNTTDFYIDMTLTVVGRGALARNDGSFTPTRYRFGDDEIDYRDWNALTGSDSKDAKILDTPILEALTNEVVGLRNKLITVRNSSLRYLPQMAANPTSVSLKERTDSAGGGATVTVSQQTTRSQAIIPAELVDMNYIIEVDNDLLYVPQEVPVSVQPFGGAKYVLPADPSVTTVAQGTQCSFTLRVQTLTTEVFDVLAGSTAAQPRTINTVVWVTGQQSGLAVQVPVSIIEFVG